MDTTLLILLIEVILFICIFVFIIIRNIKIRNIAGKPIYKKEKIEFEKAKPIRIIPLLIIMFLTLCMSSVIIPDHFAMQKRMWVQVELPHIFMDISNKYMSNNNSIVLNQNYKAKLYGQFYKLTNEYGFTKAKKKIIPILSYVMETELPKSGGNIDTMALFNKIEKVINDTLSTHNIK